MAEGPIRPAHNAALPFTRYVVGHGDYTPVGFSNPGPTTWGHQLATSVLFTSPLNVLAENPAVLLDNLATRPALDLLKALPTVWDETRVLPASAIGERALMARRAGDDWHLAALTGDAPFSDPALSLSFLAPGRIYHLTLVTTGPAGGRSLARTEQMGLTAADTLPVTLGAADGLVAVFRPEGDAFFSEAQIRRLRELMQRGTEGEPLSSQETAERDALIEAELIGSAHRAAALADALGL